MAHTSFIALNDPAYVLADIEAKRRLVAELVDGYRDQRDDAEYAFWHKAGHDYARFKVLRLLALPFAGHPDYRAEWAPGVSPS